MERRDEALSVILAQIKRLQAMTEENHATERKGTRLVTRLGFIETNGTDHMLPILTVLPNSPMPYNEGTEMSVL